MSRILIDVCTICNCRCKYCLHQYKKLVTPRLMQFSTFQQIIDILSREGYTYAYLYMSGESFLNPHLFDMINYASSKGVTTDTSTKLNMRIDWSKFDTILTECDSRRIGVNILITIDSFIQETSSKIAPGIDTTLVTANFDELVNLRQHPVLSLFGTSIICKYNESESPGIQAEFAKRGVTWTAKDMGYFMGDHIDQNDIEMIKDMIPSRNKRFSVINNQITHMTSCANVLEPAINPEGDVTICCHDMLYTVNLGNIIAKNSMRQILNSQLYQETLAKARRMQLPCCRGCN